MNDLRVLDAHAALVDVGSEQMFVSIAGGSPEVFGTVTSQLHALREWLLTHHVRSVAMEGHRRVLAAALRGAGSRRTGSADGQWPPDAQLAWAQDRHEGLPVGATLHAHGLLRAGFVPPAPIRRLQDYLRLRAEHVSSAASHIQHMQKALERMNIKLHDVISSLTGASGLAVVRAIL